MLALAKPIVRPIVRPIVKNDGDSFTPISLFEGGVGAGGYDGSLLMPWFPNTVFEDGAKTIPTSDGGPAGNIVDLSGNGRDVIAETTDRRPTWVSTRLTFEGVTQRLEHNMEGLNYEAGFTFIVCTDVDPAASGRLWWFYNDDFTASVQIDSSLDWIERRLDAGGSGSRGQNLAATKVSGSNVISLTCPPSGQPNIARINGVQGEAQTSDWGPGIADNEMAWGIPKQQALTAIMLIKRVLTVPEIEQVEAYFAARAGITLP